VNVKGVLLAMKYEIPAMLANGGGSIINNSSIFGHIGLPGGAVYVASKHAVIGLSKSAALELANKNIRVNTVSPAVIQTDMFNRVAMRHPAGSLGSSAILACRGIFVPRRSAPSVPPKPCQNRRPSRY
jgi:NAD(P)-dependent dehydrogenase (short-subunit alcohol dehydrogenase family)